MDIDELLKMLNPQGTAARRVELDILKHKDGDRAIYEVVEPAVAGEAYCDAAKQNWVLWVEYADGSAMYIEGLFSATGWKFVPYDRDEVVSYTRDKAEELCMAKERTLGSIPDKDAL